MAKGAKGKQATVEQGTDSDPNALFTSYNNECKSIGITPYQPLKDNLINEENPNRGTQIIVLPNTKGGESLGSGGCRCLVNAMISIPFTATKELRICSSSLGDAGASSIASLLIATATKRPLDPSTDSTTATQPIWQLEYIELTDNDISHVGAKALGRSLCVGMNTTLNTLILDFNRTMGSQGVAALCTGLATNSTLSKLSLKHCGIDEQGGQSLTDILSFKKTALISLDISCNAIGGSGLSDLCTGLLANTSLKTLRLADNGINQSDDDVKGIETLATVLVKHPSLIAVDINHNNIGDRGAKVLLPSLVDSKQITEFKVDTRMNDELFKQLFRASAAVKKKKGGKKKKK